MEDRVEVEEMDIVIVGAGICGLATALSLHRKGLRSVVLERSETLRAKGAAVEILTNGWRALDYLGIGSKLRQNSIPHFGSRDVWLDWNKQRAGLQSVGESRCVIRKDLIHALAKDLPHGTVRCGCHIVSLELDPFTSFPILQMRDGRTIKAKASNSVVAKFLKIKPQKVFPKSGFRGLTTYPNGHGLSHELVRTHVNNMVFGRSPINENQIFWFVLLQGHHEDSLEHKDPELIKQWCVEEMEGRFPKEIVKIVQDCDTSYLILKHNTYRTPWEMLVGNFRKGTVTVAGDAMHLMGPFLGQGSSAALEDGIVLARCLAQKIHDQSGLQGMNNHIKRKVGEAIDAFVKERRMRLVGLSAQTYLTGLLLATLPIPVKLFVVLLMLVLFYDQIRHTRYDCGPL
ncbi:hypothetical protein FNV43_RR19223 [Rhamnella rubrinervis]|uniref:FAD-binding domain-containing protein n=1 Tax=Rhamnella rubrinervis TaxID=2594499 RepID=A0A8K0GTN3_9ROSA|nr:hypothetical protein FNV43_RR19223 [Rhamnella rubrinervis]